MHSIIAATTLVKTFTRKPIPPKAAARFVVRAFRALLRFPIRTVRKQQAVVTLATIEPSRVRIDTSEREEISGPLSNSPHTGCRESWICPSLDRTDVEYVAGRSGAIFNCGKGCSVLGTPFVSPPDERW